MEGGVLRRVKRYEVVGHDASAAIYRAVLAQGLELQRVGEVDAVGGIELTMLEAPLYILAIGLALSFHIRLLDAAAGGCEVVGDGELDHRTVGKLYRTLDESLSEGASSHDFRAVLIL